MVTPALMRDFSPQVGRAQAMAFWTMGPVLGSLLVTMVSSHTLDSHPRWQFQFQVAGWAGLAVCVIALLCLRELNRADRDRIVGALEAQTAVALNSRGLSHEEATRHPYRQMFRLDIVGPAVGISVFLLMYYTAIGVLPAYFQTNLNFTASESNSLLNWLWATTAVSMLGFGALSDKLRVRKPLVLAGALATVPVEIAFLSKAGSGSPSFSSIAILLALTGVWLGAAYAPWMAAFTETVEHRNPALSATGLAIWGWILRVSVASAVITIPLIVSAVTPLVDDGPAVLQAQAYFDQSKPLQLLLAEAQAHPEVFSDLAAAPDDPAVQKNAIETVGAPTAAHAGRRPDRTAESSPARREGTRRPRGAGGQPGPVAHLVLDLHRRGSRPLPAHAAAEGPVAPASHRRCPRHRTRPRTGQPQRPAPGRAGPAPPAGQRRAGASCRSASSPKRGLRVTAVVVCNWRGAYSMDAALAGTASIRLHRV